MEIITITEFRKKASLFFSQVKNGETVIVSRHGKIIAEIVPPGNGDIEPAGKKQGLRLSVKGVSLSQTIRQEHKQK